jgi:hypothetical protein
MYLHRFKQNMHARNGAKNGPDTTGIPTKTWIKLRPAHYSRQWFEKETQLISLPYSICATFGTTHFLVELCHLWGNKFIRCTLSLFGTKRLTLPHLGQQTLILLCQL